MKQNISQKHLKSIEFSGYTRTGICTFPALDDLNCAAVSQTKVPNCDPTKPRV